MGLSRIEVAKATFRRKFKRGEDWQKPGSDHVTSDIDMSYFDPLGGDDFTKWWGAKVQVHGDSNLRDEILNYLTSEPDGYAVNVPGAGGINLRTCASTRRGAIVQWLLLVGLPITADLDDAAIESIWQSQRRQSREAYCIRIKLFAAQEPSSNVSDTPGNAVAGR